MEMSKLLSFEEWKELHYGKNHKVSFDENGVCDGTCDNCLKGLYTDYVRNNITK